MTRSRTIEWEDPAAALERATGMDGIDVIRAIASGALPPPPIAATLGFDIVAVEPGEVVFELEPAEHLYNPIGSVHGGVAATLLDSAMGCAIHTRLPAGVGYSTAELRVGYVRPLLAGMGAVRCTATVLHVGRTTALAEGRIESGAGKLLAHGTTTCLILRPPARSPG